jgi:hypothetical protein
MAEIRESSQDQSVGELVKQIGEQSAALARKELELAEAEVTLKARRAGTGAGVLGGAGLLGLFALGSTTAAAIMALALAVPGWLAALIIGAVYGGLAGIGAAVGALKLRRSSPPTPELATESVREDIEYVKAHAEPGSA